MKTSNTVDKQKISKFNIAIAIAAIVGLMAISIPALAINANAQVPGVIPQQSNTDEQDTVTIQKTGVSSTDPLPGHSAHQLVMALPPRSDGKIWVGTVTWTANKPEEVVVLHGFNSTVKPDSEHGSPLTAPIAPEKQVAISLVKTNNGTPVNSS